MRMKFFLYVMILGSLTNFNNAFSVNKKLLGITSLCAGVTQLYFSACEGYPKIYWDIKSYILKKLTKDVDPRSADHATYIAGRFNGTKALHDLITGVVSLLAGYHLIKS